MEEKTNLITYKKRYLLTASIFGILGIIVIPILTYFFASQESLLESNLSVIGSKQEHRLFHIILCSIIAIYYHAFINFIMCTTGDKNFFAKKMLYYATPMMILSCFFPYAPEENLHLAEIHVILSFGAVILYGYCVFLYIMHLRFFDTKTYNVAIITGLIGVFFLGMLLLKLYIVNSLVEILLIALISSLLLLICFLVYKAPAFNIVDFYQEIDKK